MMGGASLDLQSIGATAFVDDFWRKEDALLIKEEGLVMICGVLIPLEQLRESSFYQSILEEGRKEGRRQVYEEARLEGAGDVLRWQLEQRFGALPHWAAEKIEAADLATLERWCIRIMDAESLEDVLAL